MRHSPSIEPKFHQIERFLGAGKSMSALLAILIAGCSFRIGLNILVKGSEGAAP